MIAVAKEAAWPCCFTGTAGVAGYLGIGELPFGASVCIYVYFIIFLDDYYTFYLIYQLIWPHILALYLLQL